MVQIMSIINETAQTKLTEMPLESIDPLDTKVVQCLVSLFFVYSLDNYC